MKLAAFRTAIAGEVTDIEGVKAAHAAILRLFEGSKPGSRPQVAR